MEHIIYQSAPADPNEDGYFVVDTATGFPVAGPFDRMTRAETELSARADARKTTRLQELAKGDRFWQQIADHADAAVDTAADWMKQSQANQERDGADRPVTRPVQDLPTICRTCGRKHATLVNPTRC